MASNPENEPRASREVEKPPIEPIRPPTVEEMRGQDIWNTCAVRNVVSGVMGLLPVGMLPLFQMGVDSIGKPFVLIFCLYDLSSRIFKAFTLDFRDIHICPH